MNEVYNRVTEINAAVKLLDKQAMFPSGASEEQINKLLEFAGPNVPKDYLDFLRLTNGFVYELFDVEKVIQRSLEWRHYWPGGLFIGHDSAEGIFLIHMEENNPEDMPIIHFPDEQLTWHNDISQWKTFNQFFLDMFPLDIYQA